VPDTGGGRLHLMMDGKTERGLAFIEDGSE